MIEVLKTLPARRQVIRDLALELLSRHRTGRLLDLSCYTLLLPGKRAGRRLLEILAELCAAEKILFLPPKTETDISFMRSLAKEAVGNSLATPCETADLWREILKSNLETLQNIFACEPGENGLAEDTLADFSNTLSKIRRELAWHFLNCGLVEEKLNLIFRNEREQLRWSSLNKLFVDYEKDLKSRKLFDDTSALREFLSSPPGNCQKQIYIFGYRDNIPLLDAILKREDFSVYIVTVGEEDWFDELGHLKRDAALPALNLSKEHRSGIFSDPLAEAQGIYQALEELSPSGKLSPSDITVASQDDGFVPFLTEFGKTGGIEFHNASGKNWRETEAGLFLQGLRSLLMEANEKSYLDFLRLPCVERTLAKEIEGFECLENFLPKWQDSLWQCLGERPAEWMFKKTGNKIGLAVFDRLEATLKVWRSSLPKNQWHKIFSELAEKLSLSKTPEDESSWRQTLDMSAQLCASRIEEPDISGKTFLQRLANQCKKAHVTLQTETGAIDITGWLELVFDDSPVIFLCDVNEGILPRAKAGDLFLPDRLRGALGLATYEDIKRRDRYFLRLLLDKEAVTYVFSCRQSKDGSFRKISTLLCDESDSMEERACYVQAFYNFKDESVSKLFPSLFLPERKEKFPEKHIDTLKTKLARISASSLGTFLECPFKFALKQLEIDAPRRLYSEMTPQLFGTFFHEVMERFAKAKIAGELSNDPKTMEAFLTDSLDICAKAHFGRDIPAMAKFQLRQIEKKFAPFSYEHSEREKQGWKTVMAEKKLEKNICGIDLVCRVDRVDYREKDNAVCVIDYKTSFTAKKLCAPDKVQLYSYKVVLEDVFPDVYLWSCAFANFSGDKVQKNFYDETIIWDEALGLTAILSKIQEMNFRSVYPSDCCKHCQYKFLCDMTEAQRMEKIEELLWRE